MLLKIDQEFKNLIPPLTHEDRTGLENNIKEHGCETPITVWDGTIIDGHNRYEICVANGIPFEIKEISFADRDDAKVWMIKHELEWKGRKITPYIRSSLVLKMEGIIKTKAKSRQAIGHFNAPQYENKPVLATLPELEEPINTRKELSKLADVGERTIDKVKVIEAKATPEQLKDLMEDKVSINKVYQEIKKQEIKPEQKTLIEKPKEVCPIDISPCPKNHESCEHWYDKGCNYDFDSKCESGVCVMPSAQKPNAVCPHCGHDLTIDYDNWKVIK